jgi:hypothetical protein
MTLGIDSQNLESYVPPYDAVPKNWEEARPFIVEQLKKLAEATNVREIGFYLDQELLSGKSFYPGVNLVTEGGSSQGFRSILRIVVPILTGLSPGANTIPHLIANNNNFTLIDLWCAATQPSTLTSTIFSNSDTIRIVGNNILITSDGTYTRANVFIEYIQEL